MFPYKIKVAKPLGRKQAIIAYEVNEPTITVCELRSWPDDKLHIIGKSMSMGPAAQSMIDAEQRRREAWKAPAGAAFWISCAALLVSLAALALALAQDLVAP